MRPDKPGVPGSAAPQAVAKHTNQSEPAPSPLVLDYHEWLAAGVRLEPPTAVQVQNREGTVQRGLRVGAYHRRSVRGERLATLYVPGMLAVRMASEWLAATLCVGMGSLAVAVLAVCYAVGKH